MANDIPILVPNFLLSFVKATSNNTGVATNMPEKRPKKDVVTIRPAALWTAMLQSSKTPVMIAPCERVRKEISIA
jgi:hypothetical protein